jgi:hypothetical protein
MLHLATRSIDRRVLLYLLVMLACLGAMGTTDAMLTVTSSPLPEVPTFTAQHPLTVTLSWSNPTQQAQTVVWKQQLWDYLSEKTLTTQRTTKLPAAASYQQTILVTPPQPGDYRFSILPPDGVDATKVRFDFGYSHAPWPRNLPDDWPIGWHMAGDYPSAIMPDGAKWFRIFAGWNGFEPKPGVYDWSVMDKIVRAVAEKGGKIIWVDMCAPSWSLPESERKVISWEPTTAINMVNARNREAFRSFLSTFWDRYGEQGTVCPGTIGAVECWNETNVEYWTYDWGNVKQMGEDYANFVQDIWDMTQVKAPHVKIIGLSMSSGQHYERMQTLMDGTARNGRTTLAMLNAYSAHTYSEMMRTPE